jgi:uncharacterized protein YbjT (DUF2867 family)
MKLVVIGAAGRTGRHVVSQALDAGHDVTAFVRKADSLGQPDPRLVLRTGDARSRDDVTSALHGQHTVISTLGSNRPGSGLLLRATTALVHAAGVAGLRRVVVMSSLVATPNYRPTGVYKIVGRLTRSLTDDKLAAEEVLKGSDLDWTIVHATLLDRAPAGTPIRLVGPGEPVGFRNGIARADVAAYLLTLAQSPESIGTTALITAK